MFGAGVVLRLFGRRDDLLRSGRRVLHHELDDHDAEHVDHHVDHHDVHVLRVDDHSVHEGDHHGAQGRL